MKKHTRLLPRPSKQPFTTLALALFLLFLLDLFTSVLRRFDPTLLTAEPALGAIAGMLALVRDEERHLAWIAFGVNLAYVVIVLCGIALQRLSS